MRPVPFRRVPAGGVPYASDLNRVYDEVERLSGISGDGIINTRGGVTQQGSPENRIFIRLLGHEIVESKVHYSWERVYPNISAEFPSQNENSYADLDGLYAIALSGDSPEAPFETGCLCEAQILPDFPYILIVSANCEIDFIGSGSGSDNCLARIGNTPISEITGFNPNIRQALTHNRGCLEWLDIEECA